MNKGTGVSAPVFFNFGECFQKILKYHGLFSGYFLSYMGRQVVEEK